MDKNFLLISLEEHKTKKIAEVISSDTARKIIDHLTKKDATESEISKDLGMPISTVHYNLKQLQEAGLVIVDEFHYSSKGKEINHYKLANKYIIIAPRTENNKFMDALKKIIPLVVITAVVGFIMQLYALIQKSAFAGSAKMAAYSADNVATETSQVVIAKSLEATPQTATELSRSFIQSSPIALFLIIALSIIIIYLVYLWVKKE